MIGPLSRITLSLAITAGGIVAACHPVTPTPAAPEVSKRGPRPPKIETHPKQPKTAETGFGSSEFGHASRGHREAAVRVADAPTDAGVSDVIDLPPVPDAEPGLLPDSGTPLAR